MMKYQWTLVAIAYFLGVLLADILVTPHQNFTGLLTLAPVLLALEWSPLIVTLGSVPLVVLAAANAFGTSQTTEGIVVRTVGIVVGIGIGAYLAYSRQQGATTLDLSRAATEAAHRAILPAVPASVGVYRLSSAYRSASEESLIGGDFYKVIETGTGMRLIVGDVQGKGLDAIAMTAAVLGCFREWAPETDSLQQLVERLDARVLDKASGAGDFVTAVVASLVPGLGIEVANCGHPSPVHLPKQSRGGAIVPERRTRPLGLFPEPKISATPLSPGDRLLFFTDGLFECRDASGTWIELDGAVIGPVANDPFDDALELLLARVEDRVGTLRDDVALLLVEVTGSA
jgi:sigma-B regulation protein RsbU (phosphoserine phosphatase)